MKYLACIFVVLFILSSCINKEEVPIPEYIFEYHDYEYFECDSADPIDIENDSSAVIFYNQGFDSIVLSNSTEDRLNNTFLSDSSNHVPLMGATYYCKNKNGGDTTEIWLIRSALRSNDINIFVLKKETGEYYKLEVKAIHERK